VSTGCVKWQLEASCDNWQREIATDRTKWLVSASFNSWGNRSMATDNNSGQLAEESSELLAEVVGNNSLKSRLYWRLRMR
jgi:hypothetical protein